MDIARHIPTDRVMDAMWFSEQPIAQREVMRHELACPVCENSAFFRRASKNGHAACFGARHRDDCDMAAGAADRIVDGQGDDVDALFNPGQHIVIDFNFGAAAPVNGDAADMEVRGQRGVRHFVGNGARPDARAHRRLSGLLRNLIGVPGYADADRVIEGDGFDATPSRDFFVHFDNFNAAHLDSIRGMWGTVANVNRRPADGLYLNTGDRYALSILVPNAIFDEVLERSGAVNYQELRGAQVLVVGTPWRTISKKMLCTPQTVNHIAIQLNA